MSSSYLQHSNDIGVTNDKSNNNCTSVAIPKSKDIKVIKLSKIRRKLFSQTDLGGDGVTLQSSQSSISNCSDEWKRLELVTTKTFKRKLKFDSDDEDEVEKVEEKEDDVDGQIGDQKKSIKRNSGRKSVKNFPVPLAEQLSYSARHFGTARGTSKIRTSDHGCEILKESRSNNLCRLDIQDTPVCAKSFSSSDYCADGDEYDFEFDKYDHHLHDTKRTDNNTFRFGLASGKRSSMYGERKVFSFNSSLININNDTGSSGKAKLKKFHSKIESQISRLLSLDGDDDPDLIGDFSVPCALPLLKDGTRHEDLKSISHNTMKLVLEGGFDQLVGSYRVIDCRFPYEYNGGHIVGSKNLYTKESVASELLNRKGPQPAQKSGVTGKRHILIFHCEFSVKRGPKLLRFLRNGDRDLNKENYPKLLHPEIYLLEGGYKEFYQHHPSFCIPEGGYVPMNDRAHSAEYATFKGLLGKSSKASRVT